MMELYQMRTGEVVRTVDVLNAKIASDGKPLIQYEVEVVSGTSWVNTDEDGKEYEVDIPAGSRYMMTNRELQRNATFLEKH